MPKNRIIATVITAALLAILVQGCGSGSIVEPLEPVFRRADAPVSSIDPIYAESMSAGRAVALCYETLLQFDYATRPYRLVPYIAASMPEISADGRELTLRLRDDVFFGPDEAINGRRRRVTAMDVEYSLKRLADAKLSSPGYWLLRGKVQGIDEFHAASAALDTPTPYDEPVAGIRVVDSYTLVIALTGPAPDFLWALAMPYTAVVPREAVELYGKQFGTREVGSGPFRLVDWRRGHRMLFNRRENRSNERDHLENSKPGTTTFASVEYLVMNDPSTKWLSFMNGTFDLATEISRDNWDAVVQSDGSLAPDLVARGVEMVAAASLSTSYIAFNMDDPVVGSNCALRRALKCAFDTSAWVSLNKGRVVGADSVLPPGIAGRIADDGGYGFDLDKAKTLLKEAGYENGIDPATGRRLELTLTLGRTDQEVREGAELMASFFSKIGISLKLDYLTFPAFLKAIANKQLQMFHIAWLADYPDALNFLHLFHSSNVSPGSNRCNFRNAQFDALYDQAALLPEGEQKDLLCQQMQSILAAEIPWICLHYPREIVLKSPRLQNFAIHDFPLGMEKHFRARSDKTSTSP